MKNTKEVDNTTPAVVYLRWACEPTAERHQAERDMAADCARALGLEYEVVEEVGLPGERYPQVRADLREGRYGVLILREIDRVGHHREAIEEVLSSSVREGWRMVSFKRVLDTAVDDMTLLGFLASFNGVMPRRTRRRPTP